MQQNRGDRPSVLMVTGEYPPALGGIGDYTELLCGHLVGLGLRLAVLTRGGVDDRVGSADAGGVRVLRTIRGWGPSCWPQVAAAARSTGATIVHIQYQAAAYGMNPALNTLPLYLRARLRNARIATTFHDLRVPYLFPKAGPVRHAAIRALDRSSHATVVTNQMDLIALQGHQTPRRHSHQRWLIPLGTSVENAPPSGYDRAAHRETLGADDRTLLISYFGFMNESKGVEALVDALAIVNERGISAKLVVIGGEAGQSDPTNRACIDRVRAAISSKGLDQRVSWTGFASPEQVSAHLLSSDLCVLPFRDGASLRRTSLLAALEHGLAIVTTMPLGPEPMLRNGENVTMVRRDDPISIADAVEYLWHDEAKRARLSTGAAALAAQFRWPEIAQKHVDMYEWLLGRPTQHLDEGRS